MKKLSSLLIASIVICGAAPAQGAWRPPQAQRHRLANGLTVLTLERRSLPIIAMQLMVRSGSAADPESLAGLADFTASLLSRGTRSHSATEIADAFDFVGASTGASAAHDAAYLQLTVLAKDFEAVAPLFFETALEPAFRGQEAERYRNEALSYIRSRTDRPQVVADEAVNEELYLKHPYHRPAWGYAATVERIDSAALAGFHQTHYRPGNCVLAVVGDFKTAGMMRFLMRQLSGWTGGATPAAALPPLPRIEGMRAVMIHQRVSQAYIDLGFFGPARGHRDYQAARVMNYILGGGGFVSRLSKSIRVRQGLAYDVDSYFEPRRQRGPYLLSLQTKCASADTAVKSLIAEMRAMRDEAVPGSELTEAKNYFRGEFPFRFETYNQIAGQLLNNELYGLGSDYLVRSQREIRALTAADIQKAAREYLRPDEFRLVLVTDTTQTGLDIPGMAVERR